MAIDVVKLELKSVQDASGLDECIRSGRFKADQAFRKVLRKHGAGEDAVARVPMIWSGGCDGVITPHATVFAKVDARGGGEPRLAIGTALSAELKPEDIGRPRMVEIVADG